MSRSAATAVAIQERLRQAFNPETLTVEDDSARHAGHPGARSGKGHFKVTICAAALDGLNPLAAHRRIYQALGELMQNDIHALNIRVEPGGRAL